MPAARVDYRIVAVERNGLWVAHATHADTGRRFGIEASGRTERDATDRLTRWLTWQSDHAAALDALQEAERTYHRTVAGRAFRAVAGDTENTGERQQSLDTLEDARRTLDRVRARRPEIHG